MSKLNSVRKGDRAEYISQGIFSALGYSVPILRQEDFGLDFLCTTVENKGKVSYPAKSFTVQLKTNHDSIVYDLSDEKKIKWLLENNLPFFICYFDTKDNRVDFYSTSLIGNYLINKPDCVTKISFRMDKTHSHCVIPHYEHKKGNKIFIVDMKNPFLSIKIGDLAVEKTINKYRRILSNVLKIEYENIVYRNLNLPFMRWVHDYTTNEEKILFGWAHFSEYNTVDSQKILENVGHIIISLAYNYKVEGKLDDYNKLKDFVLRLPFNNEFKSSLVNLDFRDNQGNEK